MRSCGEESDRVVVFMVVWGGDLVDVVLLGGVVGDGGMMGEGGELPEKGVAVAVVAVAALGVEVARGAFQSFGG